MICVSYTRSMSNTLAVESPNNAIGQQNEAIAVIKRIALSRAIPFLLFKNFFRFFIYILNANNFACYCKSHRNCHPERSAV